MGSETITAALAEVLRAVADERATKAAALDDLTSCAIDAVALHDAGDTAGAHERIRQAMDLAYEELGDCDPVQPLADLLGYQEPDPS